MEGALSTVHSARYVGVYRVAHDQWRAVVACGGGVHAVGGR